MRDVTKRQWTTALLAASDLSTTTRVALLKIAEKHMLPNGVLAVGVEKLAGGRDQKSAIRRYSRYFQQAYEACWLRQTSPGFLGHSASYMASIPDPGERQETRPRKGMTDTACHTKSSVMTDTAKQSSMTDTGCHSIHIEEQGEQGERVAVNEDASGEHTTTAGAANPTEGRTTQARHTEDQPRQPIKLVPGEYPGGPVDFWGVSGAA